MENILVTGGCGFIGSHLVDYIMEKGNEVLVLDNLSAGNLKNLEHWKSSKSLRIRKEDLLSPGLAIPTNCDTIYHVAANPDVRIGSSNPSVHFEENIVATYNLLEAMRKSHAKKIVFTSTSTIYGEAEVMPTAEDYGPLEPISIYGGTKLACEALISSYAYTYGFKAMICRLANVIGARSTHGIIYDFLQKLEKNPQELEILGDGTQTKSYLHVKDCVEGILTGSDKATGQVSIFNIGSEDQINIMKIAEIVCEIGEYENVKYKLVPTADGRGWTGDVKVMRLDISKLKLLGWKPLMNSEEAVVQTVRNIIKQKLSQI
ncbi:MAG: NAD-dependent epimerase/dehydratase family protein [Nitrososphaerales archaeon]